MDKEERKSLFDAAPAEDVSADAPRSKSWLYILVALLVCCVAGYFIWHSRQQMRESAAAESTLLMPMVDFNDALREIASGDAAKGIEMVKILADSGMPQAQLVLAICCAEGRGCERNVPAAAEFAARAAEKNIGEAYLLLCSIYLGVFGNEYSNQQLAFEWCRKSFEKRIPHSTYMMALCYMNGIGCKTDINAGFQLIAAAANENDPRAVNVINGMMSLYPKLSLEFP